MEALAAAFFICGHEDWANEVLKHFSYGLEFLKINSQLLSRYAACSTGEEVQKAEETWLAKLEREYAENRERGDAGSKDDLWKEGNTNHRPLLDSEDEENDGKSGSEEEDDEDDEGGVDIEKDPYELSEEEDDEEEMAELRRKVLASKPFSDTTIANDKPRPERIAAPQQLPVDSDAESDVSGLEDDSAFDNIINATPVTDRTGIQAKERLKGKDGYGGSVSFSRKVVNAPKKW